MVNRAKRFLVCGIESSLVLHFPSVAVPLLAGSGCVSPGFMDEGIWVFLALHCTSVGPRLCCSVVAGVVYGQLSQELC